jgi:hypothetical protein
VKKDCRFFEENSIIDYSLLVGLHDRSKAEPMDARDVPLNLHRLRSISSSAIIPFFQVNIYLFYSLLIQE